MAGQQDISASLRRNLRSGKEYDKLIPTVKCESTPLGEGDTYFTVDQMRAWIEKYQHQTAKLAPVLRGRSLQDTVEKIYRFLYDHVQYQADGALQQLRSPACTWAQRRKGVDCKSYSVFASSILTNMGIKHFIRQVRQPYFFPDEFTHVYVVIPVDQSKETYPEDAPTFVLDATKHHNIEVDFLQKVDLPMTKLSHVGLNAPQDERIQEIVQNFETFCQFLLEKGVPLTTVNAMRARVNQSTSKGGNPQFKIVNEGIIIDNVLFPLHFTDNTVSEPEGLGFAVTTAVGAATAGKKLLDMLPADFIGDSFGAVFANGFRLDCWNTTSSPAKAKERISLTAKPFFEAAFERISNTNSAEEMQRYLNMALEGAYKLSARYSDYKKYSGCTQDGWKLMMQFADAVKGHLDTILDGPNITFSRRETTSSEEWTVPAEMTSDRKRYTFGKGGGKRVTYPVISNLLIKAQVPKPQLPSPAPDYGKSDPYPNGSTGNLNNQNNNSGGNNKNSEEGSKNNTGLIIGGGVLAASLLLMPMMKKGSVATAVEQKQAPVAKPRKKAK